MYFKKNLRILVNGQAMATWPDALKIAKMAKNSHLWTHCATASFFFHTCPLPRLPHLSFCGQRSGPQQVVMLCWSSYILIVQSFWKSLVIHPCTLSNISFSPIPYLWILLKQIYT
jgi:hypothetical protein